MAQRRFHCEHAFEHYLRSNRLPYVAVDEAKRALAPTTSAESAIKSFDFVVYGADRNLLVDVKGRKRAEAQKSLPRLESWVTLADIEGMQQWQALFGADFEAVFVFAYWSRRQPPDGLFEELFEFEAKWYALREVSIRDYVPAMTTRSPRWRTVNVPSKRFAEISRPFTARRLAMPDPRDPRLTNRGGAAKVACGVGGRGLS